jgi:hypothetical protein
MKVYVSGPLTGIDNLAELKTFYEKMAAVCAAENIEAYVPHLWTDPLKNPHMTPQEVYALDRQRVSESNLVLAYVGVPSIGVGQEIEIAREKNIPIVLLMEKDAKVSRMARGNPAVIIEIRFSDFQDGLAQLSQWLHEWRS